MNGQITITDAHKLKNIDHVSTKFLVDGRKYEEFFDTLEDALQYKDDEDRHGSYWISLTNQSGFLQLIDDEGEII